MSETHVLRALLVLFVLGLLAASGVLYVVSLDAAAANPEYAHLRMPVYLAVVVGLVPILAVVAIVFGLLGVVDAGEAFSARTVVLLRRLVTLFAGTAVYLGLALAGFWIAFGQMHPTILLLWFGALVVVLLLLSVAVLLVRLFSSALELRQENELTV